MSRCPASAPPGGPTVLRWGDRRAILERYGVAWAHEPDAVRTYNKLRQQTYDEWENKLNEALLDRRYWPLLGFKDEEDDEDVARVRDVIWRRLDRKRSGA